MPVYPVEPLRTHCTRVRANFRCRLTCGSGPSSSRRHPCGFYAGLRLAFEIHEGLARRSREEKVLFNKFSELSSSSRALQQRTEIISYDTGLSCAQPLVLESHCPWHSQFCVTALEKSMAWRRKKKEKNKTEYTKNSSKERQNHSFCELGGRVTDLHKRPFMMCCVL